MITACPYCGQLLPEALNDGIGSCTHCRRIFNSSTANKLLAGAWMLCRNNYCWERFLFESKLEEEYARLVWSQIEDEGCTIDDFQKRVKALSIA